VTGNDHLLSSPRNAKKLRDSIAQMERGELEAEIERLKIKCDKQATILRRLNPANYPDTLFICGEGGEKDNNGLPERLHICPAYGCDWFQTYTRTERVFGPEW
jgi:hypothetical protein